MVCQPRKSNFRFPFVFFLLVRFSAYSIYVYTESETIYVYNIHILYIYMYLLPFQMEDGKRKPKRFSLIRLPFAHRTNTVSLSFVHLLTKKQTEVVRLQTD